MANTVHIPRPDGPVPNPNTDDYVKPRNPTLKGQCPGYAYTRASSVFFFFFFSSKDNRTVILMQQDFPPNRTADGDLLFTLIQKARFARFTAFLL